MKVHKLNYESFSKHLCTQTTRNRTLFQKQKVARGAPLPTVSCPVTLPPCHYSETELKAE